MEAYNLNLEYCGILRNFICSLSDDIEEKEEDEQQEDNPVENDSSEDEPSDAAEKGDPGIYLNKICLILWSNKTKRLRNTLANTIIQLEANATQNYKIIYHILQTLQKLTAQSYPHIT